MKFKRVLNWKQHLIMVHDETNPFNCPLCDEKFAKKPKLKKHMSIVHDKKS